MPTILLCSHKQNEDFFQRDIDNIGLYLSDNKLTLNVEKTINLNLFFKTMNVLRLNNATLKRSNEVKYLGVLIYGTANKTSLKFIKWNVNNFRELFSENKVINQQRTNGKNMESSWWKSYIFMSF